MATIVDPKTGVVQPSFVPVAKHCGVSVVACPPHRGNRRCRRSTSCRTETLQGGAAVRLWSA